MIETLPILLAQADPTREGAGFEIDGAWPWPAWAAVLLMLLSAIYIAAVYVLEARRKHGLMKVFLALIRVGLVWLIFLMMYGWVIRPYRTDLPDVLVIIDDSASMLHEDQFEADSPAAKLAEAATAEGFDAPSRLNLVKSLLLADDARLLEGLAAKHHVKFYRIAAATRPGLPAAPDEETALREMSIDPDSSEQSRSLLGRRLREILEQQRGRPTAAVVLLTDGVTTEGPTVSEAATYARRKGVPLLIVGVGAATPPKDLRLADLLVDETVYVGDMVNFQFRVGGEGFEGQNVEVRLRREGERTVLARQSVRIEQDGALKPVRLTHRPTEEGDFRYVVEVAEQAGEANTKNNAETRLVRVQNATLRVLLVQAEPSYEWRYLKVMLGRQTDQKGENTIELTTVLQHADPDFARSDKHAVRLFPVRKEDLYRYDVLILGDIDPTRLGEQEMQNIVSFVKERGGSVILASGPIYSPLALRDTPLAELFPVDLNTAVAPAADALITQDRRIAPTRLGLANPAFAIGDTPAETARIWARLPGVYWRLLAPDLKPAARVLAESAGETDREGRAAPMIVMHFVGAGKVVFHATDETWRWRFRVGDRYFGRYWTQMFRYLSRSKLAGETSAARLFSNRKRYRRGEPVRLRVRFLDDRSAPAEDDGVTLMVQRKGGRKRRLRLQREGIERGAFEGVLSGLAEGEYKVSMTAPLLDVESPNITFVVEAPPGEQSRLEMDEADLRLAAKRSQGRYYRIGETGDLLQDIPTGRRVLIQRMPPEPIWNFWPLALLFIVGIVTEWLLRKANGML